jgi:hypothetical protein
MGQRAHYRRMSRSIFALMLASWVGYFWLGYQLGKGCSDIGRKRDNEDLERRYKIVTSEVVEAPGQRQDAA